MDLGHWITYLEVPDTFYGFIYCITNKETGKQYIGKKQAKTIKKLKPLKGKKNKRHREVDTDWKEYTGSSPELNKDIENLGKDKFNFEITRFCTCKWELSYYEAKEQFDKEVLFNSDKFYNGVINLRIGKPPKTLGD